MLKASRSNVLHSMGLIRSTDLLAGQVATGLRPSRAPPKGSLIQALDRAEEFCLTPTVGYMNLANSPLVSQITYQHSGTTRMTTTKAYDDLNRLTLISSQPSGSGVPPVSFNIHFVYDAKGRRIQKTVTNGVAIATTNFVYDGWNLIGILAPNSSLRASFLWGNDLSGSPQGAGGVGGLLEMSCFGSSQTNSFVAYDGNGNVASLINAASGIAVANYGYGPFGEVIRSTGPMAKANPIRFSTKYDDDESDLLYYGYRYYKPSTAAWLSRDPVLENAFRLIKSHAEPKPAHVLTWKVNIVDLDYTFTGNDAVDRHDLLGLCDVGGNTCGKDATTALLQTQRDVRTRFANLSYWKQSANCEPYSKTIPDPIQIYTGMYGWDMLELTKYWSDYYGNNGCGSGQCFQTVHIHGANNDGCYYSWDVNYTLFGWIGSLCNMSEQQTLDDVAFWKNWKHIFGDGGNPAQAIAFTIAGYNGWPATASADIPAPPPTYSFCHTCGKAFQLNMDSTWPHSNWWW